MKSWWQKAGIGAAFLMLLWVAFGDLPKAHFMTPFREGQTALLAAELAKGSDGGSGIASILRAPTPLFGYPWDLPMEFPLYQRIVAALSSLPLRLDWIGWGVNAGFTIAAFLIAGSLMARVVGRTRSRALVLIGLASPVYFGYGSAFLIEGCALFFAVLWLWGVVRCFETGGSLSHWALAFLACALAALVKPTTWAPAAAAMITFMVLESGRLAGWMLGGLPWKRIAGHCLIIAAALVLAKLWISYSDGIKARNPLGARLVSSGELAVWNYGTLGQKTSPMVWLAITLKTLVLTFGVIGLLLPFAAGVGWLRRDRAAADPRIRHLAIALLVGAVCAPAVFTNLHLQHDYYQFANGIFLLAGLGILVATLDKAGHSRSAARILAFTFVSVVLTTTGYLLFRKGLRDPADGALLVALRTLPPGRAMVCIGFDYTGKLPYYSGRRALMTIDESDISSGRLDAAIALNRNIGYGAVAVASPELLNAGLRAAESLGMARPEAVEVFYRTFLIVPAAEAAGLRRTAQAREDPGLRELITEVRGKPSGYRRVSVERFANGVPRGIDIVFKRRDQLFHFRSRDFSLIRLKAVEP